MKATSRIASEIVGVLLLFKADPLLGNLSQAPRLNAWSGRRRSCSTIKAGIALGLRVSTLCFAAPDVLINFMQ
jgi:hypothetical protein